MYALFLVSQKNQNQPPYIKFQENNSNRRWRSGVIRTDAWLEKNFSEPLEICENLLEAFNDNNPRKIYEYLLNYGMYNPDRSSRHIFQKLKEKNAWGLAEKIFLKYKNKWAGPDIAVYIFPAAGGGLFTRSKGKSGVSFKNMLFLFLPADINEKELEALFIHEYHHSCRMNSQKKSLEDYTLLDDIIMEGLAEHAVEMHCGKQYRGKWCTLYSKEEIMGFWEKILKKHLTVKKAERIHHKLLYGEKPYPSLLGYAAGYEIISQYREKKSFSTKLSFIMPAESFVKPTLFKLDT